MMRLRFEEKMTSLHSVNRTTSQAAQRYASLFQEKELDLRRQQAINEKRLREIEELKVALANSENKLGTCQAKLDRKHAEVQVQGQATGQLRLTLAKNDVDMRSLKAQIDEYEKTIASG